MKVKSKNISSDKNQVNSTHHLGNERSGEEVEMTSQKMYHEGGDSVDQTVDDTKSEMLPSKKNDDEEAAVVEDPVWAFMNKMPPDWEAAEKHAEANLVLKNTTLAFDKPDSYCPCCQMPFPEESNYYPICAENAELWETGEGFPMFFEFIKYLIYLMIFLSLVYFLPCAFLMYNAY